VDVQRDGAVLLIGLDREDKRNAFDTAMFHQLALAYGELDRDDDLRAGVLYAKGAHFTGGMDLLDMGPRLMAGEDLLPEGGINPWATDENPCRKPVVAAVQGTCFTLGIELLLAADVRVAADDARFGQIEVSRGILPFGGATIRLPQVAGWGNAMRWILTGEHFDAAEALRLGLVQEVVPVGQHFERAVEIAQRIAAQAPLGVQAALRSARLALRKGPAPAEELLFPEVLKLLGTEDAGHGLAAFLSKQPATFVGR
jgi:enoyl-CoA hydratase/carnithine racemase